ncbi:MAG: hypothetical protein J6N78_03760 [Clostridia bacterium]|nr:hypothetical protein [Clostridia bacterium]
MERKVRIISISGQPLSGKSTAIDKMTEVLKEKGIKEEDIHVVSVGKKFREYFNKIMDLASNLKNKSKEELKEISVDEELKQFCSNQLLRKEMKDALVNLLMSDFDFNKFDIEKANNSPELKEIRDLIDTIVDTKVAELGEEAIKRNKENEVWIMDSRLAFSNIPESFAVRLTVRDDVAGKRLYAGTRKRGKEDNNYADVQEAMEKTIKRGQGEERRYKERYGVELSNEENYNLIIDTSFSNVDDIAKTILTCEECERSGKYYGKRWTSPKTLLPTQRSAETFDRGNEEYLEKLKKDVAENGYAPSSEVEIFEYEGRKYLNDGNHRVAVLAELGNTMIPYEVNKYSTLACEAYSEEMTLDKLCTYTNIFRKNDKSFSYEDIYPGIVDIAEKNYMNERYMKQYLRMVKEKNPEEYYNTLDHIKKQKEHVIKAKEIEER